MKHHSSFEAKVSAAFLAAVVVVSGLAAITWQMATDANQAARWVVHTHEVLDHLARIRADTLQIELNTQSFRISGDPARLAERDAAIADREALLGRLQQLMGDNPLQLALWTRLREVINERLAISRHVEMLRKSQGMEAASAYVAGAPLQATRERTHQLLREMDQAERRLLDERSAERARARQAMITVGTLVAVALLVLLSATYVLIRRQLRETEASRRALAESEQSLSITLHSIGDGVLATDTRACITRMNPVAERLSGWPIAEARGRPVGEVFRIVHEQTRAPAELPVAKVLVSGEVQGLTNHTVLIARDGAECPIANSAAPIRDSRGHLSGVVLVFRDVTMARREQRTIQQQNELLEARVRERTAQLLASEDHLRSVMSSVPAMIAYVDAQQRYVYVNQQYVDRFAPGRADISGCTVREVLGESRYAIAAPLIAKVLDGQSQSYDWEPFPGVWQAINYLPKRDAAGAVAGYYVLGIDVSERKRTEARIQSLNLALKQRVHELDKVSRALKTLSAGNRTMLRATDEPGLLESMCEAIVTIGGYAMAVVWYRDDSRPEALRPMAQCGHPGGLAALSAQLDDPVATAVRTGRTCVQRAMMACPLRVADEVLGALAIYASDASAFAADEVNLLDESTDDLAFGIATLRARAEQETIEAAMHHMTRHDSLTGLPNEARFTELLDAAIDDCQQRDQSFAVLQTNVEQLSDINDALGFSYGDEVLRELGSRLRHAAPESAVVARLRGDEFAILLPGAGVEAALTMVERLQGLLRRPFPVAEIPLDILVTTGIAVCPQHGSTPHDLYRHMDIALKQAKKRGVGHAIFDPAQGRDQPRRLNMAGELRRAIEGGDLLLYLQPKVEFASGRVCGAEALVRWNHAERGLIAPVEFIGLAEHTGLIKPLTEWVIEAALRLNQAWTREGCTLPIAVNLSARNLHDESLLRKIRRMQSDCGVAPGLLELEITETAVMDDAEFALRVLHGLRDEGIPLYIDDFGTGYSSLSYLQKLPVECIKIDQSFIRDMAVRADSAVIVRSTIDLVHDLGRTTVAEGVETQWHWDQLSAMGCDIAQGYFIARPMPAHELPGWVERFKCPGTALRAG